MGCIMTAATMAVVRGGHYYRRVLRLMMLVSMLEIELVVMLLLMVPVTVVPRNIRTTVPTSSREHSVVAVRHFISSSFPADDYDFWIPS